MPIEITVPRLGWSMEEGIFVGWAKSSGETVSAGDILYTLESEKATQEVESIDSGTLHVPAAAPKAGDRVVVGQLLGYLLKAGERMPGEGGGGEPKWAAAEPIRIDSELPSRGRSESEATPAGVTLESSEVRGNRCEGEVQDVFEGDATPRISPRARRVARELGVAWAELVGSGSSGRIREKDVRAATARASGVGAEGAARGEYIELSAVRRTIAERMHASAAQTASVTLQTEVDATEMVAFRERRRASGGRAPGFHDCFARLLAKALAQHPRLNARWEGDGLRVGGALNLGIAVDTEAGLMVPVLRDVGRLSLDQIAERSRDLIERARVRRLTAAEMKEGTFTLTNLGAFGVDAFTPILNYPECAILGLGRIRKAPVVREGCVVMRDVTVLSLTFDHRALDGGPAARFLQDLTRLVESAGTSLGG